KRRLALLPIGCLLNTVYSEKGTVTKTVSQSLFPNKRCSKACIYGTKPNQMKNMECYFYLIVLTA
ncbi:hypothetical protein, partial [Enterococcus faecium]|uniref:hypothetical protein n=1 Tax=Enterococcus faecium TaxID=1352 RepID=UPI000CF0E550